MKKISLLIFLSTQLLLSNNVIAKENASKAVEFLNSKPASETLPFSEMVRVENTLYLSGQIGWDPQTKKLAKGGIKAETNQTLMNIKHTLEKHGYSMDNVVKCTVMLTDIGDFKAFNQVYTRYFSPPYPTRSAFAVKSLALNSIVEVECIASTL